MCSFGSFRLFEEGTENFKYTELISTCGLNLNVAKNRKDSDFSIFIAQTTPEDALSKHRLESSQFNTKTGEYSSSVLRFRSIDTVPDIFFDKTSFANRISIFVNFFQMAAHLAQPLAIDLGSAFDGNSDVNLRNFSMLYPVFRRLGEFTEVPGFHESPFVQIDFLAVWERLTETKGILAGFDKRGRFETPFAKALGYYSQLFHYETFTTRFDELVYSLGGLELLLNESGSGVTKRMLEKISILMPDLFAQVDIDKSMRDMYKLRSALLHGGMNLDNNIFAEFDGRETQPSFWSFHGSINIATVLFIRTLQEMIVRGLDKLEFKVTLA